MRRLQLPWGPKPPRRHAFLYASYLHASIVTRTVRQRRWARLQPLKSLCPSVRTRLIPDDLVFLR